MVEYRDILVDEENIGICGHWQGQETCHQGAKHGWACGINGTSVGMVRDRAKLLRLCSAAPVSIGVESNGARANNVRGLNVYFDGQCAENWWRN